MELLKLISANELLAQLICFLIVFFLLRALLWRRFLGILDDRRARIQGELSQIDQTRLGIEKLKAEFESNLKNIDEIAAVRMKETVEQGKEVAEDIKDRARQEAQRIISEAKSEIEQTVVKTKEELRKQVVELTLLATEKIIDQKLTEDSDRKFISSLINQMDKKDA